MRHLNLAAPNPAGGEPAYDLLGMDHHDRDVLYYGGLKMSRGAGHGGKQASL
jgi:hypothetical protein